VPHGLGIWDGGPEGRKITGEWERGDLMYNTYKDLSLLCAFLIVCTCVSKRISGSLPAVDSLRIPARVGCSLCTLCKQDNDR